MTGHNAFTYCPKCATKLEPKTILGEEHEVCPVCGWTHYEDPKVACLALLVESGRVLLVQRTMLPFIGQWSLPAGFVNAFELPEDAVVREVLEETGLEVQVIRLATVLSGREHPRGADVLLVYQVERVGGDLHAGDDAGDAAWFDLKALPTLAFESTRKILELAIASSK